MEQNTLLNTEVSRRYSKALFSISSKDNSEQEIYNEVSKLLETFKSNNLFFKHTVLNIIYNFLGFLFYIGNRYEIDTIASVTLFF